RVVTKAGRHRSSDLLLAAPIDDHAYARYVGEVFQYQFKRMLIERGNESLLEQVVSAGGFLGGDFHAVLANEQSAFFLELCDDDLQEIAHAHAARQTEQLRGRDFAAKQGLRALFLKRFDIDEDRQFLAARLRPLLQRRK